MVGNHQTSNLNWLFGVPRLFGINSITSKKKSSKTSPLEVPSDQWASRDVCATSCLGTGINAEGVHRVIPETWLPSRGGRHRRLLGIDFSGPFSSRGFNFWNPSGPNELVPRLRIHIHVHLDFFFSRFGQGTIGGFKTKQLYLFQHFFGQVDYSTVSDWTRTKQKMAQIPGSTSLHSKNMF